LRYELPATTTRQSQDTVSILDIAIMATKLAQPLKWAAFAAAVIGLLAIGPKVAAQDRSPIVDVSKGDPEMNAAIARGRGTLPTFWASHDAPKPNEAGHALKVHFTTRRGGEHIWIAEVKKLPDGTYSGFFANQPRDLPGKRAGDAVKFTEADISDWMFMRNGKIVGGETIRPTLKSLPKADADALRARMEQP
jgi:uncharacterized protein YegJ (DUF2314 family)